jgi:hypothetical protein
MYQQLPNDTRTGQPAQCVLRLADKACIPFAPANSDYQAYLQWLAEGNAPYGADEPLPAEE